MDLPDLNEMEFNPIAAGMGLLGGVFIFYMMGNTGKVQLGLIWRILGLLVGVVACYFVASFIINKD